MRSLLKPVSGFLLGACAVYEIQRRWYGLCWTTGDSMIPTIDEKATLLVNKQKYSVQLNLKRGDVVLCRSIQKPRELIIKRVAALEGDPMPDTYEPLSSSLRYCDYPVVPLGYIWLRGDNDETSNDSRSYGPVPLALVQGRVMYQLHPAVKKIESGL